MEELQEAMDEFELVFGYLQQKFTSLDLAAAECGDFRKRIEVGNIGKDMDDIANVIEFFSW